jgi:hypothetical protein
MANPLTGTASGQSYGVARVSYTHDAMIDAILMKPEISHAELGAMFGYSGGWVGRIIGSDAFQARLAERKVEIVNPEIKQSFEERIQGLAVQSLNILQEKLQATQSADLAIKSLQLSTTALGMGARQQNVVQQNNFVVALPQKAASEADWAEQGKKVMAGLHAGGANQVMDVEVKQSAN